MAISPLSNIIFVNQNMNVASAIANMQFNRYDVQNAAAQAIVNEKEKSIEETRPAEETMEIDPEREHTRQGAFDREREQDEASKKKRSKDSHKGFMVDEDGNPRVDIRV